MTLSQETGFGYSGGTCLEMACGATPGVLGSSCRTGLYALPFPGQTLTLTAWFLAATAGAAIYLVFNWFDASSNPLGTTLSPGINDNTSTWTEETISGSFPGAAQVSVEAIVGDESDTHYLDAVLFAGGSSAPVNVNEYLSGQIGTVRGRSLQTDQYQCGSCSFTLRNESRLFDPSNTASPYYGTIVPRVPVQVNVDGVQVFGGYIDDIEVDYEQPDICTVAISCLDGLNLLANAYLVAFDAVQQTTGERISAVLARPEVAFPALPAPNIATGQSTLQVGTFDQIPALDHCQTCALSEQGYLFVNAEGVLTFFDRYYLSSSRSVLTFSDTGPVGYQGITQKSQALLLYNVVIGQRDGGTEQVAYEPTSEAQYGVRTLMLAALENLTDADVLDLCQYLAGRYSQPNVRFDTVTVELQSLSSAQLAAVLALDITDLVTVQRTPPGSGTPATISLLEMVDGVSLSLDVSGSKFTAKFNLYSVDARSFFILNDPVFGLLDSGNLLQY
jgi:hypothetical protein